MFLGCDIAQKTADIILTDDNFASIVKGIEEGRLLFDNLRLSIAYTLAHLWPEVCPIILNFTLGMPLGLGPLQVNKPNHFTAKLILCVEIRKIFLPPHCPLPRCKEKLRKNFLDSNHRLGQ
jgi:magnesium-transporting ATPase (P-type)